MSIQQINSSRFIGGCLWAPKARVLGHSYSTRHYFPFVEWALIQTYLVGYSYNICATMALMCISCQANCYCSSQGLQLGKILGDFSLPSACIASSGTVKVSQWWEDFLTRATLISPCSVLKVCGFFRNRFLFQFWWAIESNSRSLYSSGEVSLGYSWPIIQGYLSYTRHWAFTIINLWLVGRPFSYAG